MKQSVFPKLFVPGSKPGEAEVEAEISMRAFNRRGQEFLLLPDDAEAAERSLEVYSPQSWLAKVAIKLLRRCIRLRIPTPVLRRVILRIPKGSLLFSLLKSSRRNPKLKETLPFALLAGNPKEPSRRFVLLSFDDEHKPRIVMKIGVGRFSSELIEKERRFMEENGNRFPCFPKISDSLSADEFAVFTTEYLRINERGFDSYEELYKCVSGWVHHSEMERNLGELAPLDKLYDLQMGDAALTRLCEAVRNISVVPVVFHGDLVPWNIRADAESNDWVVIDWERGEYEGVPAWDWFHFTVQTSLLVNKDSPESIMERIRNLFQSEHFREYAERCQIRSIVKELFALYIFYCRTVLMHGRGGATLDNLYALALEEALK